MEVSKLLDLRGMVKILYDPSLVACTDEKGLSEKWVSVPVAQLSSKKYADSMWQIGWLDEPTEAWFLMSKGEALIVVDGHAIKMVCAKTGDAFNDYSFSSDETSVAVVKAVAENILDVELPNLGNVSDLARVMGNDEFLAAARLFDKKDNDIVELFLRYGVAYKTNIGPIFTDEATRCLEGLGYTPERVARSHKSDFFTYK